MISFQYTVRNSFGYLGRFIFVSMKLDFKTWTDYHHQIYRIYHGIIALSLGPFFLVFLELEVASLKEAIVPVWMSYILFVLLIPGIGFINWQIWKGRGFNYSILDGMTIKEKLIEFRRVEVKKYLWMEVLSVLALAGLWLTANYFFVVIYFALLAQFSFLRPSEDRFVKVMKVAKEDRTLIRESEF